MPTVPMMVLPSSSKIGVLYVLSFLRAHDLLVKQARLARFDDIVLRLDADIVAALVDGARDAPDVVMVMPLDV